MKLFSAAWCTGCKPIKSFIEENQLEDKVTIIDVDTNPQLVADYGIRGIPTLVKEDGETVSGMNILKVLKEV